MNVNRTRTVEKTPFAPWHHTYYFATGEEIFYVLTFLENSLCMKFGLSSHKTIQLLLWCHNLLLVASGVQRGHPDDTRRLFFFGQHFVMERKTPQTQKWWLFFVFFWTKKRLIFKRNNDNISKAWAGGTLSSSWPRTSQDLCTPLLVACRQCRLWFNFKVAAAGRALG